jgi:hypothetical protein
MSERLYAQASCELRALGAGEARVRLVTRNLSFQAERQVGLDPAAAYPAALDLLVGALAADLLIGFGREASRAGTPLHDAELRLEAQLENPLVALAVVGETGSPALSRVRGTLFVSTDADEPSLRALWEQACAHAPVFATLRTSATIDIAIRLIP